MRLVSVGVWTAMLLVACDSSRPSPVAPTPTSSPTYTVFGTVSTAGNVPIADATVAVLDDVLGQEVTASAMTDGTGHYTIPAVKTSRPYGNPLVSASKPGYFTDIRWHTLSQAKQLDFELNVWEHISLGERVRGSIGDALCSGWGYGVDEGPGGDACKRFAVAVPSSGTLEVNIAAPVLTFDVDILKPNGAFATNKNKSSSSSPLQLRIPVDAGSTYQIRVAGDGITTRDFELIAMLR